MLQLPFDLQEMPGWRLGQEKVVFEFRSCSQGDNGLGCLRLPLAHKELTQATLHSPFPAKGRRLIPPSHTLLLLRLSTDFLNSKGVRGSRWANKVPQQHSKEKELREQGQEPRELGSNPAFGTGHS